MKLLSYFSVLLIVLVFFNGGCSKSDPSDPPASQVPVLGSAVAVSAVTATSVNSGGNITSDGGSPITSRGVCWNIISNPTVAHSKTVDGSGTGLFTSNVTGLTQGTTYYLRAYATNSIGTTYAPEVSFRTSEISVLPVLSTTATVSAITSNGAVSGGYVLSNGGASVNARGVCWSTSVSPTVSNAKTIDGNGTGVFVSNLTGLAANTVYYVRAYAANAVGTAYGDQIIFTSAESIGIAICSQVWLKKNLSVSSYKNGDPIPLVTDNATWQTLTTGAYCYHNNDPASEALYGKLYNWYAVNDARGLAPEGWHVATSAEWSTLSTCLGGSSLAGGALKESGTVHWASPNTSATNSSGFTALPGGWRANTGTYSSLPGTVANWWTATQVNATDASGRTTRYDNASLNPTSYIKVGGFSVRCVKD